MKNNLFIMRHGHSLYKQGKVSIDEAFDIVDDAKPIIKQSITEINGIYGRKGLEIRSSPYGRGLATAIIAQSELERLGAKPGDIIIDEDLEELKNLNYKLLHALAHGGTLELDDNKYFFDVNTTNPKHLSEVQFLRQDVMHEFDYPNILPSELRPYIANMETFESVQHRMIKAVNKTKKESILITHEDLTGQYTNAYTGNENSFLDRAGFIQLDKVKDLWYPRYINRIGVDSYFGIDK